MSVTNTTWLNFLLSRLTHKIIVPSDFHSQVSAIQNMLSDDVSGLVDSLTDFSVNAATVDYNIETSNSELTNKLKRWLNLINIGYNGMIPVGIKALAKEYFKERWKNSSFCVLKIAKWEGVDGIIVPTKMYFVQGESITAADIDDKDDNLNLLSYQYYLGKSENKNLLDKNVIYSRPYGRWYDKYPVPYLIKKGVYHNWKIIESLKDKESQILEEIIPYMLLVKKGTEGLAKENIKTYSNEELQNVIDQFQTLMNEMKNVSMNDKNVQSPIRATNFDEEIEHLIPDLKVIFSPELFTVAERGILSGLGFIDIAEAISSSRRESILNPKIFMEEIRAGVEDFKQILNQLALKIIEKNQDHRKYMNSDLYITSSPVKAFMTDEFKQELRLQWKNGQLSSQTYAEMVGEVDYRTEVYRREQEAKDGIDYTMYPHLTDNQEDKGIDLPGENPKKEIDKNGNPIDDDKIESPENYNLSSKKNDLEIAPYQKINDLPSRVKNNMPPNLQKVFLKVFNQAYATYHNDSRAFRIAWGVIKKLAKKGKNGEWVRKNNKEKLSKAMVISVLEENEEKTIDEAMKEKEIKNQINKNKLLDKLLEK